MYSAVDGLVSEMEKKIKSALERLGDREDSAQARGQLLHLSGQISKHYFAWLSARRSGHSYQEGQHEQRLYGLEHQVEKVFWPPNRLDIDIKFEE